MVKKQNPSTKKSGLAGNSHMKARRKKRIIVLEELNFIWDEPDLTELAEMWRNKATLIDMVERFKRNSDEIILALMHLARIDRISSLESGILQGL